MPELHNPTQVVTVQSPWGTTRGIENGSLVGPRGPVNIITSPRGPRPPLQTPFGQTGAYHHAYDTWVNEALLPPFYEANVVALAPWRCIHVEDQPFTAVGRLVAVEHPPLEDGRRVFSRLLHLDADRPMVVVGSQGAKGAALGSMGDTGMARGEHLHHEFIVEKQAGLLARPLAGSLYERVRSAVWQPGGAAGTGGSECESVDWLAPEWLEYINSFEWGVTWPRKEGGREFVELLAAIHDARDQHRLPSLSVIETRGPEGPWDRVWVVRQRDPR